MGWQVHSYSRHQARQMVERLEKKLVDLEQAPAAPPDRDMLAKHEAERSAYFVTLRAPRMRSKDVTVHPDGSWTMTFELIEPRA